MILKTVYLLLFYVILTIESYVIIEGHNNYFNNKQDSLSNVNFSETLLKKNGTNSVENASEIFNGVYMECVLLLSFTCLQRKTLQYLHKLNELKEISIIGDFVKFVKTDRKPAVNVKINITNKTDTTSQQLSHMIDKAVDTFFDSHVLTLKPDDIGVGRSVDEFVGRKKMKGGHDDGKKKMMMMALMCMKMKMMVVMPAMMGMMGMMSFKGMMFGMMTFFLTKMMLLMKLLEKKGGGFGGGVSGSSGGGDGAWNSNAGGGWNQGGGAGDQGASGGGYNAAGEWQNRAMADNQQQQTQEENKSNKQSVQISYITPHIRTNRPTQNFDESSMAPIVVNPSETSQEGTNLNDEFKNYYKFTEADKMTPRVKRNIIVNNNDTVYNTNDKQVNKITVTEKDRIKINDKTYSAIDKLMEYMPFSKHNQFGHNERTKRDVFDALQYLKKLLMNIIFNTRFSNYNKKVNHNTKTRRLPYNRRQSNDFNKKRNIRRKTTKSVSNSKTTKQPKANAVDHSKDARRHKEKLQILDDIIGENPWM